MTKVSFSQYQTYSTCPMQYKLTYVDKLGKSSANIHTIFGSAIHETVQNFLKVMYGSSKKDALAIDLDSFLLEKLKSEYIKESQKSEGSFTCTKSELDEFYNDGKLILNWFKKKIDRFYTCSGFELVGIEIPIDTEIKNGIRFVGYIDIVLRDISDNSIIIIDLKTSTNGWNKYQRADKYKNSQIILYKKYYSEIFNVPLDKIRVEYQIMRRKLFKDSPFPIPYMSRHTPPNGKTSVNNVYSDFIKFVDEVFDSSGNFNQLEYPKNPGVGGKNCKYCEFKLRNICDGVF